MSTCRPFFIKRLNGWYIKTILPNGKRSQKLLGKTKEEAYRAWKGDFNGDDDGDITTFSFVASSFTDAMKRLVERGELSEAWHKRVESQLKKFGKAHPGISVSSIIPFTVTTYLSKRSLAADTERTEIAGLQRCFNWAVEQGLICKNPIAKMRKPPSKPRQTWVDPKDHEKLMKASTKRFRPFLQAMWESGCRPGELRALKWDMLSKCRRYAIITKHKTSNKTMKPRTVYFGQKTTEWLLSIPEDAQNGFVFLNRYGLPYSKDAIRNTFSRLREETGLKHVVAYSYRHAFPARAITSGVDPMTIAEMMGHSDVKMIAEVYGHLSKEKSHLLNAVTKVNQEEKEKAQ